MFYSFFIFCSPRSRRPRGSRPGVRLRSGHRRARLYDYYEYYYYYDDYYYYYYDYFYYYYY